ncbi:obscurin-like [Erpetoichthys calabaricus]|uniref:obscurin-like n=1 Tax=Erpetoichthys calabaricus TaxID=27687 RepID=UPI002234E36E|nr:obscurin-like [Erpetoichthys calabaricus]
MSEILARIPQTTGALMQLKPIWNDNNTTLSSKAAVVANKLSGLYNNTSTCFPKKDNADDAEAKKSEEHNTLFQGNKLLSFYDVQEEIGRGSFSYTRKVINKENRVACAARFIPLKSSTKQQAYQEWRILSQLSHPKIASLLDAFDTKRTLVLVMELCSGRDILDHLLSKDFVTETQIQIYVQQILEGIEYIHQKNILHLDIKPANIAMAEPGSEEIKICDFGFAKEIDTSSSQYSQFGTPEFVAPEIAFQSPVSKATDIWSIGVLTYLCLTCDVPFSGKNDHATLLSVQEGKISWDSPDITSISPKAQDFLKKTLQVTAVKRPAASQCLRHEWFKSCQDVLMGKEINIKKLQHFVLRNRGQDSFVGFKSIPLMRSIAEILDESSTSTNLIFSQYNMEDKKSLPSASSSYQEESSISKQTANVLSSTMDPVSSANIWVKEEETPVLNDIWHESALATKDSASDLNVSSSVKNTYQLENTQKEEEMLLEQGETIAQKQFGVTGGDARDESDPVVHKKAPCSDIQSDSSAVTMNSLHISKDENKEAVHFTKIPRHSVIKSTFYNKSTESSPVSTRHCLQQNKARRQLMKADYSSGILSGLREPLLEHFNINEERTMHHGYRSNSLNMLAAISKSSTVDNEQRMFQSRLINSRRSQSLDFFEKKTHLPPISETRTEEYIDTCLDKPEEDFESDDNSKERIVSSICDKHDYHSCTTVGNDETYTTSNTGNEDFLPEQIKVFTRSKSVPVGLETKLADHNGIHENTMVALSHDAIGELPHDMLLRHVFAEPQTPKLSVKDVSDLISSQYDTPNSIHLSLKTIETLDNENTDFGLQRTLSESAIRKSCDLSSFHICEDQTRKLNLSFKPEDDSHNSVTHYPAQPDMFMQYPLDILPRPSETHAEIETGASAAYTEENTQRPSSPHLLMQFPENDNELEPELLNLLEGTKFSMNVFDNENRMAKRNSAGKNIMSEKSYSLTEVSSEWLHEAQHDMTPRSCSSQETKRHSAKLSKHSLFRLFKKSMSVDQPSASLEKDSPGWSQGQRKTGSTSLFKPNQQSKLVDLSITKKVKASVYNISRAVLGKQVFDKSEEATAEVEMTKQEQQEHSATNLGSIKQRPSLFSFKLPSFKKHAEPSFIEELQDQAVYFGQEVTLSCKTLGCPTPEIRWLKEGSQIKSSTHIELTTKAKDTQMLTILSAEEEDLGSYRCVASNSCGEASTSCTLIVSDLPTSPSCPEVIQVDEDGVMLMWKPIESSESITYNIQYRVEGGEWNTMAENVEDSCYTVSSLPKGIVYSFRIACVNKAGMGAYSEPSAEITIGEHYEDYHIPLIRAISTGPESSSTLQYQHPHLQKHKTYTFMSEINRGRFSIIRQCREDLTDIIFAAKITPYKAERRQAILQEYHILKKLQHSNVVKLQAAFITPKYLVLIEELCAGRELLHTLAERDSYTEMEVREFLLQILHGIEYLHSNHIIHLDLKSENIIVSENNVLKIVDFGCAQEFTPGSSLLVDKIKEICEIKAPEILEGNAVEPVTDVWSVGFLAFEMLSADCPFASDIDCEKEKNIKKGKVKFGRCYPGLTEGAVIFLKNTLNHKPWGRPSAAECLELPWIRGVQDSKRRQSIISFSTVKLNEYIQEKEKKRHHTCIKQEIILFH